MSVYTVTNLAGGTVNFSNIGALSQYGSILVDDDQLTTEILKAKRAGLVSISPDPEQVATQTYEGQVATRCYLSNNTYAANKEAMWRTSHFARDFVFNVRVAFANWVVMDQIEKSVGAATIHASLEYPAGTFTRLTFGGEVAGVAAAGATLFSDKVRLSFPIPSGAVFWIRTHYANDAGVIFSDSLSGNERSPYGEGGMYGVTTPDLTMGGSVGNMGTTNSYPPILILSETTKPSVAILGDSRGFGVADLVDRSGDVGEIARSIGPALGYTNLAISGDRAQWFLASHDKRVALSAYCTHIINEYGINDLKNGTTGPDLLTSLDAIAALFPTKPVWQTTLTPHSTSTDNWQSTGNQTPTATNATRTAVNDAIRGRYLDNVFGHFDVADAVETARNSGIWLPWHTDDGLHANAIGNLKVRASGAINPALLAR